MGRPQSIIDAHLHFYHHQDNRHVFLDEPDATFEEIIGDYKDLPRIYLPENLQQDVSADYSVQGVVWHEFLSTDPMREAAWAHALLERSSLDYAMVALVDFLDPHLTEKLEAYRDLSKVTAIREHLGWHPDNPNKRFAKRPDLLSDQQLQKQLQLLNRYDFKCGLEVFAHQLPDLLRIIQNNPNIGFTIAAIGWPVVDLSQDGFERWRQDIKLLSRCENAVFEIMGLECIFGMNWTLDQVKPWVLTAIELFGPERCMFGSHLPILKLSRSFAELYKTYNTMVADFSPAEQEALFFSTAKNWFKVQ